MVVVSEQLDLQHVGVECSVYLPRIRKWRFFVTKMKVELAMCSMKVLGEFSYMFSYQYLAEDLLLGTQRGPYGPR